MHNKDKNSHSGPYEGNHYLREKVHIRVGSLHAADFIYCLCDGCLFSFVYQKMLGVYMLTIFEKVKTILYFSWSFIKNG